MTGAEILERAGFAQPASPEDAGRQAAIDILGISLESVLEQFLKAH